MKRTENLSKVFHLVREGQQPDDATKLDAERMVSRGWLTRDRDGKYSTTRKGQKAFRPAES